MADLPGNEGKRILAPGGENDADTPLCSRCGQDYATGGFKTCDYCRAGGRENARRYRASLTDEKKCAQQERIRLWQRAHPEEVRGYHRHHRLSLRQRALIHYGGRCACCGEERLAFLMLHHEGEDGNAHRKAVGKGTAFWQSLKRDNYPDDIGLAVWCFNCHNAQHFYGQCPHTAEPPVGLLRTRDPASESNECNRPNFGEAITQQEAEHHDDDPGEFIMSLGVHTGKPLRELPNGYLGWMLASWSDLREPLLTNARREYARRFGLAPTGHLRLPQELYALARDVVKAGEAWLLELATQEGDPALVGQIKDAASAALAVLKDGQPPRGRGKSEEGKQG